MILNKILVSSAGRWYLNQLKNVGLSDAYDLHSLCPILNSDLFKAQKAREGTFKIELNSIKAMTTS